MGDVMPSIYAANAMPPFMRRAWADGVAASPSRSSSFQGSVKTSMGHWTSAAELAVWHSRSEK